MYRQLAGESRFIGPHVFSNACSSIPSDANRNLLLELCTSLDMAVANAFFGRPAEQLATCQNMGQQRTNTVDWISHSQIDFLLCQVDWQDVIKNICVDRIAALASHHFLWEATLSRPGLAVRGPSLKWSQRFMLVVSLSSTIRGRHQQKDRSTSEYARDVLYRQSCS